MGSPQQPRQRPAGSGQTRRSHFCVPALRHRFKPEIAGVYNNLGNRSRITQARQKPSRRIGGRSNSSRITPKLTAIGECLEGRGQLDEAVAALSPGHRHQSRVCGAHNTSAMSLLDKGASTRQLPRTDGRSNSNRITRGPPAIWGTAYLVRAAR